MNPKEIVKLLEAGKDTEAKSKLTEYLKSVQLSDEEVGKLYVQFASLYLDNQNELMEKYADFLDNVVEELKTFNKKEKELVS